MVVCDVDRIERQIAHLARDQQFDLVQRLVGRLGQEDPGIRRAKLLGSARLLREWASQPQDQDDAWWDDFERELRENRLTFGVMAAGKSAG